MTKAQTENVNSPQIDHSKLLFDRELSLLAFNRRVLALAQDESVPLLERLKFLCICSSNLDEFFEVRVAGIKQQVDSGIEGANEYALPTKIALEKIHEQAHELVDDQYKCLNEQLLPSFANEGIEFISSERLENLENQEKNKILDWAERFFDDQIMPILSPIKLDVASPFPLTINKGLCMIMHLQDSKKDKKAPNIAITPLPRVLPRFLRVPNALLEKELEGELEEKKLGEGESAQPNTEDNYHFIYLSTIIKRFSYKLFPNSKIKGCYPLRITRNSDLFVDPEAVDDLLQALAGELPSRRYGEAVRLEVSSECPKKINQYLLERFQLTPSFLYRSNGPVNLNRLFQLPNIINRSDLKYAKFKPGLPTEQMDKKSIFELVCKEDIFLHHPYESFLPVIDFLEQASKDPDVLVIKQTLYRTGKDSIILDHLMNAAQAGKEVIVVIELMARFDEETNISTATKLQQAGVHVVFGKVGRKTHAKMLLIVRREAKGIQRYCHLGTGNYHQSNTGIYTDYGLMTADKDIAEDVHKIFMQLTTFGENPDLNTMVQSPYGIRNMLLERINTEIEHAKKGHTAKIVAKMNGLISPIVINALYEASQAGVTIDLIVRGICCLKPQVPGVSENIRVYSVVGRFLEHERIYWFHDNGKDHIYISSADWMPRNLAQRIEQAVLIKQKKHKDRLIENMELYLNDNKQRWELDSQGEYHRVVKAADDDMISAQATLLNKYSVKQ